jgi:hypothetical protein
MAESNPESRVDAALAMVATTSAKLPRAAHIVAACDIHTSGKGGLLRSLFGRGPSASKDHEWQDHSLVFQLGDAQVAVSLMPAPIPWSELEGPCATAWWWPEATRKMQAHTNHFLAALLGGSIEPVERRILLTKIISAIVANADSVGVYWGEGTLVHEPSAFLRQAKSASANNIPGTLWLDVRVERNPDSSSRCFTTGMAPLGFLEIEVEKSSLPPEDLLGFIGNTACYIVNSRLHIPDGDTMGRSATEKYKVRHGPSLFDRPTVMQLVMD